MGAQILRIKRSRFKLYLLRAYILPGVSFVNFRFFRRQSAFLGISNLREGTTKKARSLEFRLCRTSNINSVYQYKEVKWQD